jgi:hypothetical protein
MSSGFNGLTPAVSIRTRAPSGAAPTARFKAAAFFAW